MGGGVRDALPIPYNCFDRFRQQPKSTRKRIPTGACEGVCACSTCHVILEEATYDSLDDPSEEEEDMLDQAFGLTPTSRLGCQIELREDMDGIKVRCACLLCLLGMG